MNNQSHWYQGIEEYVSILFQQLPALILCNLLLLLCCIPVFTAGPGLIAISAVICMRIEGQKVSVFREFWNILKREFRTGLVVNVSLLPVFTALTLYSLRGLRLLTKGMIGVFPACLILLAFILCCGFGMYLLPLLAFMDQKAKSIVKNAGLLCGANGWRTVLGSTATGALLLAGLWFYPDSFPLLILIWFALTLYNACYFGWRAAKRFVFAPYYAAHPDLINKSVIFLDIQDE